MSDQTMSEVSPDCICKTYSFTGRNTIGKHRALSRKVTCNFRLYFEIGGTSVKPSWKHWIL